ncbi:hypothetical protein A2V68_00810 [candidate division Kazan bacterium RBG_13_50_9]|uniref:UTP--glucose-1-phosphate uridylyltransferase n=1 Tax=candidate division Kazan bacterium RBG_13_50_9 TaxID=1798535 RepID=A0A1F4NSN3_UNCK3|nr:MAG: hypothetical protein A2V68_00810 [candidate division Kazan bacterium RBG_13_50_9]
MKKVTTGVIAIAGFGTRFLPATKAIPKEMLPIIDRPIAQYIVEEMIQSGIKDIVFVTNSTQKSILEQHFGRSPELERHLTIKGKTGQLKEIKQLSKLARFKYVIQPDMDKFYGTGACLRSVERLASHGPFILAFGDDLVKSRVPFCRQLITEYSRHKCPIIGAEEVPQSETHRYGIIETFSKTNRIKRIIEKPKRRQTHSRLAILGRYLLTPAIFPVLRKLTTNHLGEICLTDAFNIILKESAIVVHKIQGGQWYTTGDPTNYFRALLAYSVEQPALKKELKRFTKESL